MQGFSRYLISYDSYKDTREYTNLMQNMKGLISLKTVFASRMVEIT